MEVAQIQGCVLLSKLNDFTFLATKTDLRLLLECLKYQMKCPDSQKQALLTIITICKQNDYYAEFFREIGGISFIYCLSKSSTLSQVKETALFTLASLAELHESCKQELCREETFRDFVQHLGQEMPLTEKRVAVYMLSVLVSNNRCGQTLAKTSRCIKTLLKLFRHSFPGPGDSYEQLQLWTTVSSALCGSVNNPQNGTENQNECMTLFPLTMSWLQEVTLSRAELAQPICSFIGMTVANNSCAQEYFVSVGGLDSLSDTLNRVLSQSTQSAPACKMATIITKTLSACISNNEQLVSSISKLKVIPGLLQLLSSPNLNPQDQLAVVLTAGHLTDACVEQKWQLLLAGGLPIMISLLTETHDEEVRKAAMFVLQTCNRITESLGPGMSTVDAHECDIDRHWRSAGEILQRIQLLEQKIGKKLWERHTESQQRGMQRSDSYEECNEALWEGSVIRKVKAHHRVCGELHSTPKRPITNEKPQDEESSCVSSEECLSLVQDPWFNNWEKSNERMHEQARENERSDSQETSRERVNKRESARGMMSNRVVKRLKKMNLDSFEDGSKLLQHCSMPAGGDRDTQSPDIFRHPDPVKRNQYTLTLSDDEMSVLLDREINKFLKPSPFSKPGTQRCEGCVKNMNDLDSRSFGAVLRSCRFQCNFHLELGKAEDRFRRSQQLKRTSHTHINTRSKNREHSTSASEHKERSRMEKHKLSHQSSDRCYRLTPLKRPHQTYSPDMKKSMDHRHLKKTSEDTLHKNSSGRHRVRQNWSPKELCNLSKGVKRFGHSWNSILWNYPFHSGRTNVDLAKKYYHMQKAKAQDVVQRTYKTPPI